MRMHRDADYLLVYDREKGKPRLSLRVARVGRSLTPILFKVTGKPAKEGHDVLISCLAKCGGLRLLEKNAEGEKYGVRPDLASLTGAFLLLLRRNQNPKKLESLFQDALWGRKPLLGSALPEFFLLALELSVTQRNSNTDKSPHSLSPVVADAVSAALRGFIEAVKRRDNKCQEGS